MIINYRIDGDLMISKEKVAEEILFSESRIALLGDSYTESGWWLLEALHCLEREYPKSNVKIFNCGIGGDTMQGALERFEWDVCPINPTYIFILFGMNDSRYWELKSGEKFDISETKRSEILETYSISLKEIISKCSSQNYKIILGTPTTLPVSKFSKYDVEKVNSIIDDFAKIVRKTAKEENIICIDLNKQMKTVYDLWKGDADEDLFSDDHIHPNITGYRIIGRIWLNELGILNAVIPTSKEEAKKLFEDFFEFEINRHNVESLIRSCAMIKYLTSKEKIHLNSEEDIMNYWQNEYKSEKTPQWEKTAIKNWIDWHDKTDELYKKI